MTKRILLYGGTILFSLSLLLVLSDRHVTDRVRFLDDLLVRVIVVFAVTSAVGWLVRALLVRRKTARG